MPSLFAIHVQYTLDLLVLDETCERGVSRAVELLFVRYAARVQCRCIASAHNNMEHVLTLVQSAVFPVPLNIMPAEHKIYVYFGTAVLLFLLCRLHVFVFQ
jgi:hypothetical protein